MNNVFVHNLPNKILAIILSKMDKYKGLGISLDPANEIVLLFENSSRIYNPYSPIDDVHLVYDNTPRFIDQEPQYYYKPQIPYHVQSLEDYKWYLAYRNLFPHEPYSCFISWPY